jgi:mannosyltransferase
MGKFKEQILSAICPLARAVSHPSAYWFGVLGIMSLAAVLNFLFLDKRGIWFDEAVSIAIARADWPSLWQTISQHELNMSFYYVLLHLWVDLGVSEFFIRSLSVIFSILTVPVIYALGSRLFDKRIGLIAALLIAVNTFFINHAQLARGYSLMLLLVTLSSLLFVMGMQRPSKWVWATYIVTSVLAIYTHVFAAFVPAVHGLSLVFLRRKEIPWKSLLTSATAIILLILPLIVYYSNSNPTNVDYIHPPSLGYIYGVFFAITGGSNITFAAYFIPCFIALIYAVKKWLAVKTSYETWYYGLLLIWLLAPVAIAFCISQIKPIFLSRYFTICLPPLVLLAAIGIWQLRRLWSWVLIIVLLAVSGFECYQFYINERPEDWRGATAYVLATAETNDAIVFYIPSCSLAFDYYQNRDITLDKVPTEEPYYNPELYDTIPVLNTPGLFGTGGRLPQPDDKLPERLAKYDHIWLILSHDQNVELGRKAQSQELQDLLEEKYGTPDQKDFLEILVLRYD